MFGKIYARPDRYEQTILLDYLYGTDIKVTPPDSRLVEFGSRIPKLASPISQYLLDVWNFISNYKLSFKTELPSTAKDKWLALQLKSSRLQNNLSYLWERLTITGEVALVAFPMDGKTYKIRSYEYSEFVADYDPSGNLATIKIRSVEGEYSVALDVTNEYYRVYDKQRVGYTDVTKYTDYPHSFGLVPGVVICNNSTFDNVGYSDFDQTSIDLAIELIVQTCLPATNYKYFGRPWIVTPDPDGTRKAINRRDVVLQSESPDDGGKPTAIEFAAVPTTHAEYLKTLQRNFCEQMGVTCIENNAGLSSLSGIALKLMFAKTISVAEAKRDLIAEGICSLLSKMLVMAASEGMLLDVIPNDPLTYSIEPCYMGELFPLSPAEKLQLVQIADQLKQAGIMPEYALQEFYTDKSHEEILSMFADSAGDF